MRKLTVATVNKALAAMGVAERLTRGAGYYYFHGGTSASWPSSSVFVYRLDELTLDEWIAEYRALSRS